MNEKKYKVKVIYPGMRSLSYEDIIDYSGIMELSYRLKRSNGKFIIVPKALTIIEEL